MKEPNYFIPDRSFSVFGFEIYYYAVCIVCGIILATVVCALLFRRRNIPTDWVIDLLLCILPLGIIGARTFYCLTDPTTSMADWFSKFREGGLSIIGGVCGGALGVVLFCLIHKINFLRVADCLVPGVILAQGIAYLAPECADAYAPTFPGHHGDVHVAVRVGFAAGVGTEEPNLSGPVSPGDGGDYLRNLPDRVDATSPKTESALHRR